MAARGCPRRREQRHDVGGEKNDATVARIAGRRRDDVGDKGSEARKGMPAARMSLAGLTPRWADGVVRPWRDGHRDGSGKAPRRRGRGRRGEREDGAVRWRRSDVLGSGGDGQRQRRRRRGLRRRMRAGTRLATASGIGAFMGNAKTATVWMRWAAEAVDRAERDENEPRLMVLDARGMGRQAREDDAGDDCKKDGDGLKASVDTVVVGASDDRGRKRERERGRSLSLRARATHVLGGTCRERRVGPGKEESAQKIDGGKIDFYPENFFKEYEEHLTLDLNSNWIFELNRIWRNQGGDSKSEFDTFENGKEFR
uniref:Uncharacterized protein P0552F09.108 n=2 Tax=Oryza sativa subsp. japonica TaxID=39947 RepID=Q8GRN6_ORYSJ|nr:hypothetical protein [Oryza sativa Japonica Group]BAC21495.1 hypothetical protein [Oryza sativa Japonica Group]